MRESRVSFPNKIFAAILGAVQSEVQKLTDVLEDKQVINVVGEIFAIGRLKGKTLLVGTTGIGKVNAAITTAALLARFSIEQVWNIGSAGHFQEGPLRIGDVLIAQELFCGDEGILTTNGVLSAREIGIPILRREDEALFDSLPASTIVHRLRENIAPGLYHLGRGMVPTAAPVENCTRCTKEGFFRLLYGPSLSVGMVSGDPQVAHSRFLDYGAFAENMEGSAIAQTCYRHGIPFIECRGMSNKAGDRDKLNWELKKAISNCHAILMDWILSQEGSLS